ncbi:MAG: hypothetical protein NTZ39_04150 [Methanoregula sp.]|nr:hypothetical protein [Methanoregula sp.]
MSKKTESKPHLLKILKKIGENLKSVLDENKEDEYFENIILNYSLIENLLKYSIYLKMTWNLTEIQSGQSVSREELLKKFKSARDFCKNLSFYQAGELALGINLIEYPLYQKVSQIRKSRNNLIHQYWLFEYQKNPKKLKVILEGDIEASKEIVRILLTLQKEIGSEGVFDISIFFK